MKSARWICGVLALGVALTACDQTPGNDTENKRLTQDSLALVALFNATNGPNWTDNTNWLTASVDSWFGVTIEGDRVTALNLGNNQLEGPIPPELGNLSLLEFLDLDLNGLSGAIPQELGNLARLEFLTLYGNGLSGLIPTELANLSELESLYLGENQFSGPIPPSLGDLDSLLALILVDNQLSGPIPPELGNLDALAFLGSQGQ